MFENAYGGTPSWDVGRHHEAVARAACEGWIASPALDVGCGTGEDALYLATLGIAVLGVDLVPAAIERARAKARERRLAVRFAVHDALRLGELGETFGTALDVGLFHSLQPADRLGYAASLHAAVRPAGNVVLVAWSDRNPFGRGPERVSRDDIVAAFGDGWAVEGIEETTLETQLEEAGVHAWLARIRRL